MQNKYYQISIFVNMRMSANLGVSVYGFVIMPNGGVLGRLS
jgi:hypothetical protein